MVVTRRRSQRLQLLQSENKDDSPKKQATKKKAELKKRTSHSTSPLTETGQQKQPRRRGPAGRNGNADVKGQKATTRRSLPEMSAPIEEKKPRIENEIVAPQEKRRKRPNGEGGHDEDVRQQMLATTDGIPTEVAGEERVSNLKEEVERGSEQWEDFGNTSGEEDHGDASELPERKTNRKENEPTRGRPPDEANSGIRRSRRNLARKSYVLKDDGDEGSSSSSSAFDDSEDESVAAVTAAAAESESDAHTAVNDVNSDSDASFSPSSRVKQPKKRSGTKDSGGARAKGGRNSKSEKRTYSAPLTKSDSSSSTKSASGSGKASPSGQPKARPAKAKPPKPWQKMNEPVVQGVIVVPPRELRRGEKRMLKFRIFAAALAIGRNFEMTQDQANKIVEEMKAQIATKKTSTMPSTAMETSVESNDEASSSEDEWEEMEPVDLDESQGKGNVQVTLQKADEKDWWALYLRQEVNKCVRENWENAHKVNILCYIGHLQFLKKVALEENLIPSLMLTKMPSGYQSLVGEPMTIENAQRIVKWYHSAFRASGAPIKFEPGLCRFDATTRYSEMVAQQEFENDADRAVSVLKDIEKMRETSASPSSLKPTKKKGRDGSKKKRESTGGANYQGVVRNYWVEYWDKKQKRWICVDPLYATVDEPNSIEDNLSKPIVYVLAIDTEGGVREVTARYASEFTRPDFRRRRTDQGWLAETLKKGMIRADRKRAQLEDIHIRQEMVNKPLPTTLSEYKNHPLYVLEKDLLKFEGIYPKPEDQKPLGEVRGHKVYPRSTVYTLQSANNWIKMARSVKEGEKAYKVVKARPNLHVPAEEREQRYLDIFGYWQTEPYRPPKVVNGRIPCNEFGNVYMYQPSMCPIGAVHLRLPGLPSIARRLGGLECVPAVVGWDFNSCSNFPIMDGACVLEEDADKFINEWKRLEATREERENKRRLDRVLGNWRKLIRGILRLHYVKSKFGATKAAKPKTKKKNEMKEAESVSHVIDNTVMGHRQVFTHDDMMKQKS